MGVLICFGIIAGLCLVTAACTVVLNMVEKNQQWYKEMEDV